MSEQFFRSNRPGYPHPVCSELKIVLSERRLVIAVSLNVGGRIRLIKLAKLYMCTHKHYKHNEDGFTAPCARSWFRIAEPLGKCHYENWITTRRTEQEQGPVAQSIVSLTSSLRGQLVKYFTTI